MVSWERILLEQSQYVIALMVLVVGFVLGYLVGQLNHRLLVSAGIPEAVEGTTFERTAQSLGTSTVSVLARLSSWFVYGVTLLVALNVANLLYGELFWAQVTVFIPDLFVGILIFIVGIVVGDKVELLISERLKSIKLPETAIIPTIAKYSIVYIAALLALHQIGVTTDALLILLAVYLFGAVFLGGLAFKDLLASSAAGMYLLLDQPYGIGDQIAVGEQCGVVQEVDVLVTRIENDGEEFIIPNQQIFKNGVSRIRN